MASAALTHQSYLCQYELVLADNERLTAGLPLRHFAGTPGQAIRWLRRAARRLAPSLAENAELLVGEWLDDAAGYHRAAFGLGRGEALLMAFASHSLILQLEARPVVVLNVLPHHPT
ncbi:hypothetical protein ACIRST_38830 [Kitasatospora sp. NPDC101447]|uniref:hypothetical protein n=1 Tax=Kitasatospora sp. NPDC101447 TaxID=3364102 RepID=UPI0037FA20AA